MHELPEVEQPPHVVRPARLDDRGVNHQVVVDELRRARAVGEDAADRAGHEEPRGRHGRGILADSTRPAEFIYDNLMIHATVVEASRTTNVA